MLLHIVCLGMYSVFTLSCPQVDTDCIVAKAYVQPFQLFGWEQRVLLLQTHLALAGTR